MPTSDSDFERAVEQYHRAAADFIMGNPKPYEALYSQRDDVTLGNPFGPFGRGWEQVSAIMERASALYQDGEVIGFENLTTYVTPELALIVEVERLSARMGGSSERGSIALRTTTVFRPEDGEWKIMHRQADTITSTRPPESVIQP